MVILSILMLVGFLSYYQFYYFVENKIVVNNLFGKIIEIELSNAKYEVVELETYFSWITSIPRKWICIYDNNHFYEKFTVGCSNKKNKHRVQIIFSNELELELKNRNVHFSINHYF